MYLLSILEYFTAMSLPSAGLWRTIYPLPFSFGLHSVSVCWGSLCDAHVSIHCMFVSIHHFAHSLIACRVTCAWCHPAVVICTTLWLCIVQADTVGMAGCSRSSKQHCRFCVQLNSHFGPALSVCVYMKSWQEASAHACDASTSWLCYPTPGIWCAIFRC